MKKSEEIKINQQEIESIKIRLEKLEVKKKNKKGKLSLTLSILVIVISIFSLPIINKYFDRADIDIIDLGLRKSANEVFMEKVYIISNDGSNTAKNIELHLRILEGDKVFFNPKSFTLKKDDKQGGIAKNLVYSYNEFVPGDKVEIVIFSNFKNYLETNKIDTLIYNKSKPYPKKYYGPEMIKLKHSDQSVTPKRKKSLILKEINYCNDC